MEKVNDSPSHPLRYIPDGWINGDAVYGQFYNSRDKRYHLASYMPFDRPPGAYLCGDRGNFSPSRRDDERVEKMRCAECWDKLTMFA